MSIRSAFSRAQLSAPHVFEGTELCPADLGFIFGNKNICAEMARAAAELYHGGYFPKIMVSGGVVTAQGDREAENIARRLEGHGVAADDIWIETQARNSGENVLFSLPLLDRYLGMAQIERVISFGHFYAGPRFLMTMARHCPGIHAMHRAVFPDGHHMGNWHTNEKLLARARSEAEKIPRYLEEGFLSPVDIETINQRTRDLRRSRTAPALAAGPEVRQVNSALDIR